MTNNLSISDTPVEIYGYRTDPLRRGYQILWNYESTFWAALVGNNDAWRLYEILRSFCHEKTPTCSPSINLLLAILAIKDRTVLTGRIKKTPGKDYKYPGLIDILQNHGLAIAEVKGEGPEMRYVFHVNLSPGLLTVEQLAKLPSVLQQKHKELIERCQQAKQELEAKKKPSKVQNGTQEGIGNSQGGVLEIPIPPLGNSKTNNTHITIPIKQQQSSKEMEDKKHSTGGGRKRVVVALTKWGITEKVAHHLASRCKEAIIIQQLNYHEYELATNPQKITSPNGRLRTRIEENWSPPDGYSQDWRERLAAEKARAEQIRQERQSLEASLVAQGGREREEQEQHRREHLAALKRQYNTSEAQEKIWAEVKSELLGRVGEAEYKTLIAGSELLATADHQAAIWIRHSFLAKTVEKRYGLILKQLLAKHLRVSKDALIVEWVYSQPGSQRKATSANQ